ncbi:uncharacterized protein CPUR_06364 [Claviceps purpurea 20.1]|uniref:Uncharacterized protein n=1 Tax=Claviceps purpurea (strain 20.1) TaxID=1111077 RepID=M1WHB0_CLAP2|nr:uncharacterized protein CPUR_06364 [Claviceps purpurea 20.1]
MAILGIYGEEARYKEGHECSFMVAGLLYCSRVIASEILLSSKEREQQGDTEYEVFLQKRKESMPDVSMSVFSNMINLLFFARLGKARAEPFEPSGAAIESKSWSMERQCSRLEQVVSRYNLHAASELGPLHLRIRAMAHLLDFLHAYPPLFNCRVQIYVSLAASTHTGP